MRWWNRDVEPMPANGTVSGPTAAGRRSQVVVIDQLLVAPELLKTGGGDPYRVYGPFLRNWRGQVLEKQPATTPAPTALVDLDSDPMPAADPLAALRQSHGFEGTELCPCRPGEAAATDQLATFCDGALFGYEPDRNFPATVGTSYLSAALSVGTLSPPGWCAPRRPVQARSDEQHQAIAVEQELGWREFYQQALFHFPELADGPYQAVASFPGRTTDWFEPEQATGMPIIDAMRSSTTGWMPTAPHDRLFGQRPHLHRWERAHATGERDLAANNGGWQCQRHGSQAAEDLQPGHPGLKTDAAGITSAIKAGTARTPSLSVTFALETRLPRTINHKSQQATQGLRHHPFRLPLAGTWPVT